MPLDKLKPEIESRFKDRVEVTRKYLRLCVEVKGNNILKYEAGSFDIENRHGRFSIQYEDAALRNTSFDYNSTSTFEIIERYITHIEDRIKDVTVTVEANRKKFIKAEEKYVLPLKKAYGDFFVLSEDATSILIKVGECPVGRIPGPLFNKVSVFSGWGNTFMAPSHIFMEMIKKTIAYNAIKGESNA